MVAERFADKLVNDFVTIQRGYFTHLLAQFADSTFDWLYIDSDHGYKATAQELRLTPTKVRQ